MKFVRELSFCSLLMAGMVSTCLAQPNYISTVAGGQSGFGGDNGPATSAQMSHPGGIWVDNSGNMYISDQGNYRIRKVNSSGIITTIAGNGSPGYSGDGGPATSARIGYTEGPVGVDNAGNVYIADRDNHRVRKVDAVTGVITTYAGTGAGGYSGDGGQATSAQMKSPVSIAFDGTGNMFVAERGNRIIRKITPGGIISTVAGNGSYGYSGDGGPAILATMGDPKNLCFDPAGNLYIADFANNRIRKVDLNGVITTFAGNGVAGYSGDGGLATQAQICNHWGGVASDAMGNIYIGDMYNRVVRKVDLMGIITTVAGTGNAGYTGDGGPAILAEFQSPVSLMCGPDGNLYINDQHNCAIRKLDITPTYSADSINLYISKSCAGPTITINKPDFVPGQSVYTDFGDGNTSTANLLNGMGIGYVYLNHTYLSSGTYIIKHILYDGANAIDSFQFSYEHTFCATMSVQFYNDGNNNCSYDVGTDYVTFQPILVEVDSVNVPVDTVSCTSGFTYTAYGNAGDVYKFKVLSLPGDMVATCPVSGVINDTLQPGINAVNNVGVACVTSTTFDYSVYTAIPVTGPNDQWGRIYIQNPHCYGPNATLTLQHSPKYHYTGGANPAPASYANNTLTWNLSNINANSPAPVSIYFVVWQANGPLMANDTVHNRIKINPTTGDANPADNSLVVIDTVNASCDPNAIYVKPEGCILAGTNLEYTITFENIGNAPAENIYVLDTLPDGVDPSSLNVKFASHNMYVEEIPDNGNAIFKFRFPNIMLPDSSDHDGCHGMFIYTINSLNTLPYGAMINHRAGIYFDYNDPVMTNTAETNICWPQNVETTTFATGGQVLIYPNPATDELTIEATGLFTQYTITNSLGQVMMSEKLKRKTTHSIKALPAGVYYIILKGEGGSETRKFVKM